MRCALAFALLRASRALVAPRATVPCRVRTHAEAFDDLLPDLPQRHRDALADKRIESPSPIQAAAVGALRDGASAMLAAETGSGKSLAFLLPTLARLEAAPPPPAPAPAVLVLAPTRELALQLAADAAALEGEDRVQLLVVGAATTKEALMGARVIVATPKEARDAFKAYQALAAKAGALGALILDEVDALLPPRPRDRRSSASRDRAKAQGKRKKAVSPPPEAPAAAVVKFVIERNARPELQVVAASATASRATRDELRRALRNDPYGRWAETPLETIRAGEASAAAARAIVVPSAVRHAYATVEKGAAIKVVAKRVKATLDALKPRSALVFLTDSSGLAVRDAVAELRDAGVAADPLHEALRIDKDAAKKRADGPTDLGEVLEGGHARVAATFRDATVDEAPVLVTFETSARGLHFDAVDCVVCVGPPASAASYLHVAGRTGRRLGGTVAPGTVVTVLHPKAVPLLESWAAQLGDVSFEALDV